MPGAEAADLGRAGQWGLLWAALALVAATVLLSSLSALLERSGPIRLRHWAEEAEGRLRALYEQPVRFEAFRLLLAIFAKLAPLGLLWAVADWLVESSLAGPAAAAAWGVLVSLPVVVGSELLNRVLVGWDPEGALERLTPVYRATLAVVAPLVAASVSLFPASGVQRRSEEEEDEASEDEIEAFIDVGTREGILEPGEGEMLWGIVDFGDTPVRSVMTPRIQVQCAPVTAELDDLAALFVESGHSRLPLFEGSIDHIVGILHIRDLLRGLRAADRPAARSLAKPPFFVPETKPLGHLLKELQARFQQMAVVVDEYGGTAGIVTVEDLVEEIVGELVDEHEEAHPGNRLLPDGAWLLEGSTDVDVVEDLFGVDLGEVPDETVGGRVFSLLGDVPEVGETVEERGLRYTVEEVEERHATLVRVEPATPAGAAGSGRDAAGEGA
jgi:CBS domain containing-hemolysin-like protein